MTGGNGGTAPGEAVSAIELNNGKIAGTGTLQATGGSYEVGGNGIPATAVTGTGTISTGTLILAGGNADTITNKAIDGADAGTKGITVTTASENRAITGGKGINGGKDGLGEESLTIADKNQPAEPAPAPSGSNDQGEATPNSSQVGSPASRTHSNGANAKSSLIPQTSDSIAPFAGASAALCVASSIAIAAGLRKRRER